MVTSDMKFTDCEDGGCGRWVWWVVSGCGGDGGQWGWVVWDGELWLW